MPTIPSVNSIQRRQGPTGSAIVRPAGNPAIDAMDGVSRKLGDDIERISRDELAKATNKFLVLKAEQDNAFDNDPDYGSIPDRYTTSIQEGIGLLSREISDPAAREMFQSEMSVHLAQGREKMIDLSRQKHREKEIGDITTDADSLLKIASKPDTDIGYIANAMDMRFETAAENGVIGYDDAQKLKMEFRNNIAVKRLAGLSPHDRIDVFKENPQWLGNIPVETQSRLKKEAEEEIRIETSQSAAMEALSQDMSPAKANTYLFNKLGPGREYAAARAEFNAMYSAKENTRVINQRDAANTVWEALFPPAGSGVDPLRLSDIRMNGLMNEDGENAWEQLSQPQRDAFLRAESDRNAARRTESDRVTILQTYRLYQRFKKGEPDSGRDLYEFVTNNIDKYSASDWRTFSEIAATGDIGEPVKPLFSAIDEVQLLTKNWPAEETLKVVNYMNQQFYDYVDQFGQTPPAEELSRIRQRAFESYSTSSVFDLDDPMYAMDDEEKVDYVMSMPADDRQQFVDDNFRGTSRIKIMLEMMQRSNPQAYEAAIMQLEAEGGTITYDRVAREFRQQTNRSDFEPETIEPTQDDVIDPAAFADPGGA